MQSTLQTDLQPADACTQARQHFVEQAAWPRHVANETALEYERLCRMQAQDPAIGPLPGSLLAQFASVAGRQADAPPRAADEVAMQYRRQYGHPPPYPWHSTSPALESNTPTAN